MLLYLIKKKKKGTQMNFYYISVSYLTHEAPWTCCDGSKSQLKRGRTAGPEVQVTACLYHIQRGVPAWSSLSWWPRLSCADPSPWISSLSMGNSFQLL